MSNLVVGSDASETINQYDGVTTGDDGIFAGDGDDTIYALNGNDFIHGGEGADTIWGGGGVDTISYFTSNELVIVNLGTGQGFYGEAQGDKINGVENVEGSDFNDVLIGDGGHNKLEGNKGNDSLKGGGGADVLDGGIGNDTLTGGTGGDYLYGSVGNDTAVYSESSAAVDVSLLADTATGGDAAGDTLVSIENLIGSSHGDTLSGDGGQNKLEGNKGNDSLYGHGGADILIGGAGADRMFGGMGADTFVITSFADAPPAGYLFTDYMPDFSSAQGDKIDLSALDANLLVAGNQQFDFIGNEVAFTNVAGQLRFTLGFVEVDADGNGSADIQIELDVLSVSATDFIL